MKRTTGSVITNLPTTEPATVDLYDLNAKLLQSAPVTGGQVEQRLDVPAGVYLLIATLAGERWTSRAVVR